MNQRSPLTPQERWAWYASAPYPCPYLPGRTARSRVMLPFAEPTLFDYQELLQRGFRRSGEHLYAPACDDCRACISVRVPVARFQPNRSQRRAEKRLSQQLTARELPLAFHRDHYALYARYVSLRHALPEAERSEQAYIEHLLWSPFDTRLVEFRTAEGVLKMVALIDVLPDALSAVYTWYEPEEPHASYGTYAILWQIAQAKRAGLRYVYLGYWIAGSRTMAYKARFQPLEGFCPGRDAEWHPVTPPLAAAHPSR